MGDKNEKRSMPRKCPKCGSEDIYLSSERFYPGWEGAIPVYCDKCCDIIGWVSLTIKPTRGTFEEAKE
ncbi:MAG: hypothetical protein U9N61_00205 [Euryarchaeota archaeon]|nr:hypothetical protein [Euryarchaeota archaeon]